MSRYREGNFRPVSSSSFGPRGQELSFEDVRKGRKDPAQNALRRALQKQAREQAQERSLFVRHYLSYNGRLDNVGLDLGQRKRPPKPLRPPSGYCCGEKTRAFGLGAREGAPSIRSCVAGPPIEWRLPSGDFRSLLVMSAALAGGFSVIFPIPASAQGPGEERTPFPVPLGSSSGHEGKNGGERGAKEEMVEVFQALMFAPVEKGGRDSELVKFGEGGQIATLPSPERLSSSLEAVIGVTVKIPEVAQIAEIIRHVMQRGVADPLGHCPWTAVEAMLSILDNGFIETGFNGEVYAQRALGRGGVFTGENVFMKIVDLGNGNVKVVQIGVFNGFYRNCGTVYVGPRENVTVKPGAIRVAPSDYALVNEIVKTRLVGADGKYLAKAKQFLNAMKDYCNNRPPPPKGRENHAPAHWIAEQLGVLVLLVLAVTAASAVTFLTGRRRTVPI